MNGDQIRRHLIDGTITTAGPLHIGSNQPREMEINKKKVQVTAVFTDHHDRPALPGSSLRGRLRQAAGRYPAHAALTRDLFGTGIKGQEVGGRLTFEDASLAAAPTPPLFAAPPEADGPILHWDPHRSTYVLPSAPLDRVTRTAESHKLHYYEVVPAQAVFSVRVRGEGLTDEGLAFLLRLLAEFDDTDRLVLGRSGANGFGRVRWALTRVSGLTTNEAIRDWLAGTSVGFAGYPPIPAEQIAGITAAHDFDRTEADQRLTITLRLAFDGPFMIHDPTQAVEDRENPARALSHAYLKDESGRVVLKAKSLRGALRAQAERIVRTVEPPGLAKSRACYITSRNQACPPIKLADEIVKLCPACRLFGGNGWRSPVRISDFRLIAGGSGEELTQEFVAIDRFTGGAAENKKFKARYVYGPTLEGTISVDLSKFMVDGRELCRIEAAHAGLLILTLRDLIEGDITFGFGAAKGFGAARAEITGIKRPATDPDWIDRELYPVNRTDLALIQTPMSAEQTLLAESLVAQFIQFITEVNPHAV